MKTEYMFLPLSIILALCATQVQSFGGWVAAMIAVIVLVALDVVIRKE